MPDSLAATRHRQIVAVFTLLMMAVSWPIWFESPNIPHFPAVGLKPQPEISRGLALACLAGLGLSLTQKLGRTGSLLILLSGTALVCLDQQRLQAWFYQALVLSAIYAALPGPWAIGFARFFAVTLYFHSALSKLDWSFAHSMGPYLLSPITQLLQIPANSTITPKLALGLPIGELFVTFLLVSGHFRAGRAGIIAMHLGLITLLGPWALDHSANVLLWNISMILQAIVLFRPDPPVATPAANPLLMGFVQLLLMFVAILPFFERAGLCDAWPAFALYSGHVEQMRLEFSGESTEQIPEELRPFFKRSGNTFVPDITLWARSKMGTPPYPAARIQRRLARHFAEKCPPGQPIQAIFLGKAHWLTGRRQETIMPDRQTILGSISK
ncbi:MAG: hypothetical protein ACKO85_16790 [Isosphaeraceae bacterium]